MTATTTGSSHFSVHGMGLSVHGADSGVLQALESRLRHFVAMDAARGADVRFDYRYVADPHEHRDLLPPPDAVPFYEPRSGLALYAADRDELYLACGEWLRVRVRPATGQVNVSVLASSRHRRWFLSHPVFMLPLLELAKRRGLFPLHAATVSADGRGLLLPGTSGAGKTTLAVALARAGWEFGGDDMVFLHHEPDGLVARAFPDEVDVTDRTATMFPELTSLLARPRDPEWPKRALRLEDHVKCTPALVCRPAAVAFPTIATRTALQPMDAGDALVELLPNVLLTEPASSQRHVDVLSELVRTVPCFRLSVGADLDAAGILLRDLIR